MGSATHSLISQVMLMLITAQTISRSFTNPGITNMAIGSLSIAIAAACAAVSLMGAASAEPERKPAADYSRIYKTIQVKEI